MVDKVYYLVNPNPLWLVEQGFHQNRLYSTPKYTCYTKRIPVYKCGEFISLTAEIKVWIEDGEVRVDVFDGSSKSYYAGYYVRDWGRNDIVKVIDKNIKKELDQLGIKEVKISVKTRRNQNQVYSKQPGQNSNPFGDTRKWRLDRSESGGED